ncbi:MAG TPA: uridylate kinase [Gammaproteobacteria bacterium]|nr:uridylate kinase [Gammaproteobacteria bacterium]
MWVVKLGGSLAQSRCLPAWLDVLATRGASNVVIVPGGGPFAGQVRTAQAHWRFSDTAAHCMAVLAMEQYGIMLLAMCPQLTAAGTPAQLGRLTEGDGACVWMPTRMVLSDQSLSASWAVTSDSLAAWLARRLHAEHLVLVKSVQPPAGRPVSCAELQRRGMVDRAFHTHIDEAAFSSWWCGPDDARRVALALTGAMEPGVRVVGDGMPGPTAESPVPECHG